MPVLKMLILENSDRVHPRLFGPFISRLSSTGTNIQLFSLKSTRFTVGKKLQNHQTMLSRSLFLILYLNCFVAKLVLILVMFFRSLGSLSVV